jgi:hypothetical protein
MMKQSMRIMGCLFFLSPFLINAQSKNPLEIEKIQAATLSQITETWLDSDARQLNCQSTDFFNRQTPSQWDLQLLKLVIQQINQLLQSQPDFKSSSPIRLETSSMTTDACYQKYLELAQTRRTLRLQQIQKQSSKVAFVSGYNIKPSFFAYTEGQSDAQHERTFLPGSSLEILDLTQTPPVRQILLNDPDGVIRDPDISFDATKILFSWKKSLDQDDFHIYEMDIQTREIRQITEGLGFADYEPSYLPDDSIVFSSTRPVQTVDCWWTEVSNLYICKSDGSFLRRVGFDQVHTIYPKLLDDGRIIYTRWDYNDRGQIFPQALFQMNPDGTAQQELYGNSSYFPTTLSHARGIPNSRKLIAIAMGHHTPQQGKLILVNPDQGRQENQGIEYTAPKSAAKIVKVDAFGQDGELFQYPMAIHEDLYITGYSPNQSRQIAPIFKTGNSTGNYDKALFSLVLIDSEGNRELLADDPTITLKQPVLIQKRTPPPLKSSPVDYNQTEGTVYLHDVTYGPGLKGIERSRIKKLRIVELEFRSSGIGYNQSKGEAGSALVSTPIAVPNGSWDVKKVVGTIDIDQNGSALFKVPARKPIYFQALDENNQSIQTMRSWLTLMPGETVSCIGCHEDKNDSPEINTMKFYDLPLQRPKDFNGKGVDFSDVKGFSFNREIQPILDKHCIECHSSKIRKMGSRSRIKRRFSLQSDLIPDEIAKRDWSKSYLNLTRKGKSNEYVNWITSQSVPDLIAPESAGAITSQLTKILLKEHHGVQLSEIEFHKIACWIDLGVPFCGSYDEAARWNESEWKKYNHFLEKRRRSESIEKASIQAALKNQ